MSWDLVINAATGLSGVAVGGFVTWKIQERQLKHADENRFQEERMDTYTKFLSYAQTMNAINLVRLSMVSEDRYEENTKQITTKETDLIFKISPIMQKIELISSKEIRKFAGKLYELLMNDSKSDIDNPINEDEYIKVRNSFISSVRKELKIDSFINN